VYHYQMRLSGLPVALLLAVAISTAGCAGGPAALRVVDETPEPAVENCSTRSFAAFPEAYSDPANRVVGPFVLVGGATPTSAATAKSFGGQKYPALVREGHTATVRVPEGVRELVALGYGPLPQGEIGYEQGHEAVAFTACRPASRRVTFWSGFVLVREPACAPLDVYVDGASKPQRIELEIGAAC
jgi:hypothetical protein